MKAISNREKIIFVIISFLFLVFVSYFNRQTDSLLAESSLEIINRVNIDGQGIGTATSTNAQCYSFNKIDSTLCPDYNNQIKVIECPSSKLKCKSGNISSVFSYNDSCVWTCKSGTRISTCSVRYNSDPRCGSASGTLSSSFPTQGLCAEGFYLDSTPVLSGYNNIWWKWECKPKSACTENDYTWYPNQCEGGNIKSVKTNQNCIGEVKKPCPCQSYNYTDWKNCDSASNRTRTTVSGIPSGCSFSVNTETASCVNNSFKLDAVVRDGVVILNWGEQTVDNFKYYKVIRSESNSNPFYPADGYIAYYPNIFSHNDSTATPGVKYYYRVCSVGSQNAVICSNVKEVIIPKLVSGGNSGTVVPGGADTTNPGSDTVGTEGQDEIVPGNVQVQCGAAHGTVVLNKPVSGLCSSENVATDPKQEGGIWKWFCGSNPCEAKILSCGQFNQSSNSCSCNNGEVKDCSQEKYTWKCIVGDNVKDCNFKVDGECGGMHQKNLENMPMDVSILCQKGNPILTPNQLNDSSQWKWKCEGVNGGKIVDCFANKIINGECGTNAGKMYGKETSFPTEGTFCKSGRLVSSNSEGLSLVLFPNPGQEATWKCEGINGGVTQTCTASRSLSPVDGTCGPAAKQYTGNSDSYVGALCQSGTPYPTSPDFPKGGVDGKWTCKGANNGTSKDCIATLKVDGQCGNQGEQISKPENNLCTKGRASDVSGSGPWNWTCSGYSGGTDAQCMASKLIPVVDDGACGSAHNQTVGLSDLPSNQLCSKGSLSVLKQVGNTWTWICGTGVNSKECSATIKSCQYEYGEWGACASDGNQYRIVKQPLPTNCHPVEVLTKKPCMICTYDYIEEPCIKGVKKLSVIGTISNECSNPPLKETSCTNQCAETKWECSPWGSCINGEQVRKCEIVESCPSTDAKAPILKQSCNISASSQASPIPSESPKQVVSVVGTTINLDGACTTAGINNVIDCNTYLQQLKVPGFCSNYNLTKEACRNHILSSGDLIMCKRYAKGNSDPSCYLYVDSVLLAGYSRMNAETIEGLKSAVSKPVVIDTVNKVIKVTEPNKKEQQIKMESLPLSEKNNDVKVALVPIIRNEDSLVLSPVAIVFDENHNGIPDELEDRNKGVAPEEMTGVDKALTTGKSIEQPKDGQIMSTGLTIEVENSRSGEGLVFKGKSEPNQIITIFIYSPMPIVVTVKADDNGNWIYDLKKGLSNGHHEVYVAINNSEGKLIEASVPKLFFVAEARAVAIDDYVGIQPANISEFGQKDDSLTRTYLFGGAAVILIMIIGFFLIKRAVINKHG
ncbi:MAG: hypothetical protein BWY21_01163 [Parcubacteria group bacterium ADurb.Bin216]|nr:MAG: hypothetical protein BWY21_01163 [Parcubacteria group bacterium ADurb.Bin216]